MHIFLDESGDLGFDFENKWPSEHFVITLLVCESRHTLASFKTAVKRTLRNKINHKKSTRIANELHAYRDSLRIKQYFYRQIKNQDWFVYTLILNKRRVYSHLTTAQGKKKLYNFLSRFLVDKLDLSSVSKSVTLTIDRCKSKDEILDFNQYLSNQLDAKLPLKTLLTITHEESHNNFGLQVVDYFCWGVFKKYEQQNEEWYKLYAHKIKYENFYLP